MKPSKCYLAGPMRAKPQYNYPAFMDAARMLRSNGWEVFNPAEMDLEHDGPTDLGLTVRQQEMLSTHGKTRRYAERDIDILIHELRAEDGDAIVVLTDWKESTGACAEVAVAQWVGLRVLTLQDALNEGNENG